MDKLIQEIESNINYSKKSNKKESKHSRRFFRGADDAPTQQIFTIVNKGADENISVAPCDESTNRDKIKKTSHKKSALSSHHRNVVIKEAILTDNSYDDITHFTSLDTNSESSCNWSSSDDASSFESSYINGMSDYSLDDDNSSIVDSNQNDSTCFDDSSDDNSKQSLNDIPTTHREIQKTSHKKSTLSYGRYAIFNESSCSDTDDTVDMIFSENLTA